MTYTYTEENLIILSAIEETDARMLSRAVCEKTEDKLDFLIKTLPRGVYNIVKQKFYDKHFRALVLENLQSKGIDCVTYLSPSYPEALKHIDQPPAVLYCKGNCGLLKGPCFSVVGSRTTRTPELAACRKISAGLTEAFAVVTGMAQGADATAAVGALESGKIISVLANGFDYFYPASNRGLICSVAEKGLLVSEYPPHIPPSKYNFPWRNRIIAGLSRGTLVVSAAQKSGALITADYALDYGREVFAFPYGVGVASGAGCNKLIKEGAHLTDNILDIFEVFGLDLKKPKNTVTLTEEEKAVLGQIKAAGEAFLPVIAENLNTFTYKLLPVVAMLEIKGLIVKLGGNRYCAL